MGIPRIQAFFNGRSNLQLFCKSQYERMCGSNATILAAYLLNGSLLTVIITVKEQNSGALCPGFRVTVFQSPTVVAKGLSD
jgi:hypothetical protein